jgi:virginiamycin B lyase
MNTPAITMPRRIRHRHVRLVLAAFAIVAGLGTLVWRFGHGPDRGFIEYHMQVSTDIPTALAVAPDGSVWFTIEFSDAIAVFRNGRIERLRKGSQNLEPLGLAVDAAGGAWYTDASRRAISRISPDGSIQSFPLSTPIVRLGRLAVAPDGAVWFADVTTASVTRLQGGVFMRHDVGSLRATPYGIAVDARGTVWTTLQGADKLARIASDGQVTAFDVPTRSGGLGDITVDPRGAVWFLELQANKIGRYAEGRFTEFAIPTPSAGLTTLAAAPDGSVWFTELRAGKLGRLRDGRVAEFRLPRADGRPFGVAVDAANNVWYTDLSGWFGMLPAGRAKAR